VPRAAAVPVRDVCVLDVDKMQPTDAQSAMLDSNQRLFDPVAGCHRHGDGASTSRRETIAALGADQETRAAASAPVWVRRLTQPAIRGDCKIWPGCRTPRAGSGRGNATCVQLAA